MDALAGLGRGAKVFYRKDATSWQQAEFVSIAADGPATVQVGATTLTVAADLVVPANPSLQDGIPDVVQLSYLNEPSILYNLAHRYNADNIYTWAGPVLIALNPCKMLPLYTPEVASEYKQASRESVTNLAPHIYLVAAAAFRQMLRHKCSQSLVVTGESGAGKTETTKKAMQYFATLAGGTGVEDQVLGTNPILEAFGNAKTLRNHNSSRFGKLIQIHFNGSHHICGATIKTYLLEKSRVAMQLKGERSFHIFYQLVRGVTEEERAAFLLPQKPQDFHFLSQSGCYDIAGVDDAAEFRTVRRAMADVGVDAAAQTMLFRLLSGLLWLGNIEFEESGTGDSTKVRQTPALEHSAALLGVSPEALITALTTRRIVAPGEVVIKLLKVGDAVEARNSLAKAIYSAVFNWIVSRINARLGSAKATSGMYIAILDIYGFEQFDRNSFEQLCINYANERLQQQFTHHLFKLEQTEYESEGVDWTKVEFIDNQDCLDVFELMPPRGLGILAVLDSQCKFPRATDSTLHNQLLEALAPRSHFGTNPRVPGSFIIRHYAGAVQYDTNGLLDKNKDTLSADLIQLMQGSSKPLLAELGAAVQEEVDRSSKKGQTVISRFGQQLRELVSELDTTGLHFVRCIKPNAQLLPNKMDPSATLHQLRCCGVLEVARVSAAGFPTRYRLEDFASRYSVLLPPEEQLSLARQQRGSDSRQTCLALLDKFGLKPGQYQLGRTKVFFRPGVLGLVEDRWARMQAAVLSVQAGWRMYRCRSAYLKLQAAAVLSQSLWRARVCRLAYAELRRRHSAAVVMQTVWRMHAARSHFLRVRAAVVTIQTKGYRTWKFSRWLSRVMQARDRVEFEAEEARVKLKVEAEWFSALRSEYSVSMEDVPTALAAWRECVVAGASSLETVREALSTWRTAVENPHLLQARHNLPPGPGGIVQVRQTRSGSAPDVATTGGALPALGSPTWGPLGAGAAFGVPPAAAHGGHAAGAVGGSGGEAGAVPPPVVRPPVMVMTPAVVTPAVVNRFELAQELAIQVERLNLENVKLQKQLQLERSLTQRYQHKCEEQSVNWLEQVRLLQAYIQKCRSMFGDNQLPPLPRQVAALTQPGDGQQPQEGEQGGANAALTRTGSIGAVSAVRASLELQHSLNSQASNTSVAGTPQKRSSQQQLLPPPSPSAVARGTQHSVASASLGTQHNVPSANLSTQTEPKPPCAQETQTGPELLPPPPLPPKPDTTSSTTQTPPPPPPPPALTTLTSATQTAPPPLPVTETVATETEPVGVHTVATETEALALEDVTTPREASPGSGTAAGGPRPVSAFATPAAGEQLAAVLNSPTHSTQSVEPPPSSVGMQSSSAVGSDVPRGVPHAGAAIQRGGAHAAAVAPAPANASQRYVAKLGEELERVMQVLPDDVSFIREVHEGQVTAPEMDPGVELFKLKKKFDVWKREFKEKLRTTEEVLRKIEMMEGRSSAHNDPLRPSQSVRVTAPPVPVTVRPVTVPASHPAQPHPHHHHLQQQHPRPGSPSVDPYGGGSANGGAASRKKGAGSSKLLNKLFNNPR